MSRVIPEAIGEGSGVGPEHSDLVGRLNELLSGGSAHPLKIQTRVDGEVTWVAGWDRYENAPGVFVDPANGDDSAKNDGLVTPFKSIDEAISRYPDVRENYWFLRLAAGVHHFRRSYPWLPRNLCVTGETRAVASFVASGAADITVQRANDGHPWAANEHRYRFLLCPDLFGMRFPIVESGDYWLRVACFYGTLTPGNAYTIEENAATIADAGGYWWTNDGGMSNNVDFEAVGVTGFGGVYGCRINNAYWACSASGSGQIQVNQSVLRNCSRGIFAQGKSIVSARDVALDGCTVGIDVAYTAYGLIQSSNVYARNCPDVLRVRDGGDFYLYGGAFLRSCARYLTVDGKFATAMEGSALVKVANGEDPTASVYVLNSNTAFTRLHVHSGSTLAAATPGNTFNVRGTMMDRATVGAGYADAARLQNILKV